MTIFRRSCKVIASKEDILSFIPRRGIDIVWEPVKNNSSIYIVTISGTDINPSNPLEELEGKSEIDNELAKLNVISDRIRSPEELKKIPEKARTVQMNLNDKSIQNKNKYDFLLKGKKKSAKENWAIIQEG